MSPVKQGYKATNTFPVLLLGYLLSQHVTIHKWPRSSYTDTMELTLYYRCSTTLELEMCCSSETLVSYFSKQQDCVAPLLTVNNKLTIAQC